MTVEVLHAGFDGLKVTLEPDIPPETREKLHDAKQQAIATNMDVVVNFDGFEMAVRRTGGSAFSAHTGEYGAEFYFLDPENRPKHNPGVTVDFRAFFLATEGLEGAKAEFERAIDALGVDYADTQMRISRVDFAVDVLAPWFEPETDAVILPARTRKRAFEERDTREKYFANTAVTGITAGQVNNRQLTIYDKRAEVIEKRKPGWKVIWDQARAASGKPPLDLGDRNKSLVWRFEARVGSKCLRRRFEIRSWSDLDAMIGDVYADFGEQFRYVAPLADTNRNRWPTHELWQAVTATWLSAMAKNRSGVLPSAVRTVNREEHKRMLDEMMLGLMVSRAAADGVTEGEFKGFLRIQCLRLQTMCDELPVTIGEKLDAVSSKYRFR